MLTALSIGLALKSCKLSEEEKTQKSIQQNEKKLEDIQARRAANNSTAIPFANDSVRSKVIDSVNKKHGFKLRVARGDAKRD